MVNPVKVVKNLLNAEEELSEFITNGPSTGLPGHVRDRFRHRCDEFANLPAWGKALSGVAGGSINRICTPYWDAQGVTGPTLALPFTGGQCLGAVYTVEWTRTITGPLGTQRLGAGGIPGPVISVTGTKRGTDFVVTIVAGSALNGTFESTERAVGIGAESGSISDITVIRQSGPEGCGDPPEVLVPGPNPPLDPGPLPGPEPTDNPDPNNPIPEIPIPPFDDPVFGPQPIVGPDEIEPTPPASPQPSGDGIPGEEGSIDQPIAQVSGGENGEEVNFGEPPLGKIWVGCLVEYVASTDYGGIPGTGPQNTVYPTVIGNASLRFNAGRGESKPARSRWVEVVRPSTSLLVEGAFVQARLGVTATVYPLSATVCKEVLCPLE